MQPPPPTRYPGITDTYPGYPPISPAPAQQQQQPQQPAHQDQQQQQPQGPGDSTNPPAANPHPQPAGLLGTTSTHGSLEAAAAARSVQPHNPFAPEVPPYGTNPYGAPNPLYPAGPTDYPPTSQQPPPPPDGTTWGGAGGGPPPPPGATAGPYTAAAVVGIPVVTADPGWPYSYDSWWGQDNEERDATAACCAWTSFVLGGWPGVDLHCAMHGSRQFQQAACMRVCVLASPGEHVWEQAGKEQGGGTGRKRHACTSRRCDVRGNNMYTYTITDGR